MVASSAKDSKDKRDKESLRLRVMHGVPAIKTPDQQEAGSVRQVDKPSCNPPGKQSDNAAGKDALKGEVKTQKPTKQPNKQPAKQKAKSKARKDFSHLGRGSRGIDTLLRNGYRAQLDMLALAATKANIMISLNGLLMSMLIITSAQFISLNGMYIIPVSIFLVTCATATTFAVFAARPKISRKRFKYDDFATDKARLMVFEEFSDLPESEYIDAMADLLDSPQRTYRSMLSHIHDLGVTADRKYQYLYYSYTAFMTGSIITVVSLLSLAGLRWAGVLVLA